MLSCLQPTSVRQNVFFSPRFSPPITAGVLSLLLLCGDLTAAEMTVSFWQGCFVELHQVGLPLLYFSARRINILLL